MDKIVWQLLLLCSLTFSSDLFGQNSNDLEKIEAVIKEVYNWHEDDHPMSILLVRDDRDSVFVGLNLEDVEIVVGELRRTGFFTEDFIKNYERIHLKQHEFLSNGQAVWHVGEFGPFGTGANPWCSCQDVPYDDPSPWDHLELEIVEKTGNGYHLTWKWGGIEDDGSGWSKFRYRLSVVLENGVWKISSMEGFDYNELTKIRN